MRAQVVQDVCNTAAKARYFFSSAVDRVDIAAYSTIYGAHPNSFDFAADGRMIWRHLHNYKFGFAPPQSKALAPRTTVTLVRGSVRRRWGKLGVAP